MPRPRKDNTEPPNSIVAAATQVTGRRARIPRITQGVEGWQSETWRFLDTVGELRYAGQWISNALSQVVIEVVQRQEDGTQKVVTEGPPVDVMAALFDGSMGQKQMLGTFGMHLFGPGETYLVGIAADPTAGTDDEWRVLSADEIKQVGSMWEIDRGDGLPERYAVGDDETPPGAIVIRIWRPHARQWIQADSPCRAALPILRELEGLTKHVAATIDSRLAGAGLLLLPSEMSFETPAGQEDTGEDPQADPFMATLTEAMVTAISDRDSAAAVAPIVVKAPGAVLGNAQHITFATELSQQAMELRTECIRRLALSIELPPEVLLGQADSNHWSAWLISDDAIKVHIEPLVSLIVSALTTDYLWPALQGTAATPSPETMAFTLRGDTSRLRQRPNRSAEAQALHANLMISDAALLRENGFDSTDIPDAAEIQRRLVQRIASGGLTTADQTAGALAVLGAPLVPAASAVAAPEAPPAAVPAVEAPPAPAIENQRDIPAEQAAGLIAAAELMVLRALERANNRLNNRQKGRRGPVKDTARVDVALNDAWHQSDRVATLCRVDAALLTSVCDRYTRALLSSGAEHDPRALMSMLVTEVLPHG